MPIIAYPNPNATKSATTSPSDAVLEHNLLRLEQILVHVNGNNAVMFESDGSFIHLATGAVLFKGRDQRHWRFKPHPGKQLVQVVRSDALNQTINRVFGEAVAATTPSDTECYYSEVAL